MAERNRMGCAAAPRAGRRCHEYNCVGKRVKTAPSSGGRPQGQSLHLQSQCAAVSAKLANWSKEWGVHALSSNQGAGARRRPRRQQPQPGAKRAKGRPRAGACRSNRLSRFWGRAARRASPWWVTRAPIGRPAPDCPKAIPAPPPKQWRAPSDSRQKSICRIRAGKQLSDAAGKHFSDQTPQRLSRLSSGNRQLWRRPAPGGKNPPEYGVSGTGVPSNLRAPARRALPRTGQTSGGAPAASRKNPA
ncbi:MAG: hypothetical protein J3K34DRAFT_432361 [Monoraphidium minutum]|nr:MAG: hypothetical protein J3K34DRAFT_432361 [Monoraphidium minutum]